jgi:hypothetical protein
MNGRAGFGVLARRVPRRSAVLRFGREMGGFLLDGYDPQGFYCELLRGADNTPLRNRLAGMPTADFKRRAAGAEQALYNLGITFTVYSDSNAIDRILPFGAVPPSCRRRSGRVSNAASSSG